MGDDGHASAVLACFVSVEGISALKGPRGQPRLWSFFWLVGGSM